MDQQNQLEYESLEHAEKNSESYVVVNWCLGNTCNYSCSYCPEFLHQGSVPWPTFEQTIEFCKKAIAHYQGKKLYFEFTGGEVTLWKDLPALCQFLKEQGCAVGLISNGSRSQEYWSRLLPSIDHVCLSYHSESANDQHFLEIVKQCSESVRVHVNIMMLPEKFNHCYALAAKVKGVKNISLALQPLVVDFGDQLYNYTAIQKDVLDRQHDLLAKHIVYDKKYEYYRGAMAMVTKDGHRHVKAPQRFVSTGQNNWMGWDCYAGVEQIVIDTEGNIFRGWCQVGGKIGNIKDSQMHLPTAPVVCTKSMCHCNLDIMVTKKRRPDQSLRAVPHFASVQTSQSSQMGAP
jgi:MoaA/NifB/PqqE/SkfB family radical SAM enzyme